ncbi:hypothetical protein DVH24_004055 [Malus domestica]|uniref:Uncharacterized protein n=1 Tax=Malus domestica TaxID=3750 RepID=A0A498KD08_MALDO|nr:hypothetical protein DVH24_004055 [Malus domestica]
MKLDKERPKRRRRRGRRRSIFVDLEPTIINERHHHQSSIFDIPQVPRNIPDLEPRVIVDAIFNGRSREIETSSWDEQEKWGQRMSLTGCTTAKSKL